MPRVGSQVAARPDDAIGAVQRFVTEPDALERLVAQIEFLAQG